MPVELSSGESALIVRTVRQQQQQPRAELTISARAASLSTEARASTLESSEWAGVVVGVCAGRKHARLFTDTHSRRRQNIQAGGSKK